MPRHPVDDELRDLARGRLAPGRTVDLPMLSGSMKPLLAPGSVLEIAGASWRSCRPGDIIVFQDGEILTAHRLLLALRLPGLPLLYQKGDANPRGAWIRGERLVGVVVAVTPAGGERSRCDTAGARREARHSARRHLRWDLKKRLLATVRLARRGRSAGAG